jgi:hypothetical protein
MSGVPHEDIMNYMNAYVRTGKLTEEKYYQISGSLEYLQEKDLNLFLIKKQMSYGNIWKVTVNEKDETNTQLGYFQIETDNNLGVLMMTISTTEENGEQSLEGHGIARLMISSMCLKLSETTKISPYTMLFIDTDASGGFWERIGMKINRYESSATTTRNVTGTGQQLYILFKDLCMWSLGITLGDSNSIVGPIGILGGRNKNNKHSRRVKKYKKNKHSRRVKKTRRRFNNKK